MRRTTAGSMAKPSTEMAAPQRGSTQRAMNSSALKRWVPVSERAEALDADGDRAW